MCTAKTTIVLSLKPQRDLFLHVLAHLMPLDSIQLQLIKVIKSTRSHIQDSPAATLTIGSKTYQGNSAIAEYLTEKMNPSLLGSDPTQKALIHQTMLQSAKLIQDLETQGSETWSQLNKHLENKTFLIGNSYSLADISMYTTMYFHFARLSVPLRLKYYHVTRYFDLIQHLVIAPQYGKAQSVTRILAIDLDLPIVKETPIAKVEKPAKPEKVAAPKKKEPETPSGPLPSQLDIRVGKVVSVKQHPDADSLYVEEIDLGEPEPRTVVSGLVKYMPATALENALVAVLCNLKPAKMRGIESQAMVLTVQSVDGSKVELLKPPSGSVAGDALYFDGFKGTPDAVLTPKKKIWETLQGMIQVNDACVPVFKDKDGKTHSLKTDKGICQSGTIKNGLVK